MANMFEITYANVSAFERAKGADSPGASTRSFTVALLAVFFVVLMTGLVTGALVFRAVSTAKADADELHMQTGLLANTVRMNDAADSVRRGQGPEGDALVLAERIGDGSYETRIYLYEGAIVQEYALADRPYSPAEAQPLVTSDAFAFAMDGNKLTVVTDKGAFSVSLRSAQDAQGGAS